MQYWFSANIYRTNCTFTWFMAKNTRTEGTFFLANRFFLNQLTFKPEVQLDLPISNGLSDNTNSTPFIPTLKNWRKQPHSKIQFYIRIHPSRHMKYIWYIMWYIHDIKHIMWSPAFSLSPIINLSLTFTVSLTLNIQLLLSSLCLKVWQSPFHFHIQLFVFTEHTRTPLVRNVWNSFFPWVVSLKPKLTRLVTHVCHKMSTS